MTARKKKKADVKKPADKHESQLRYILVFMVVLFLSIALVYIYMVKSSSFKYAGITFQRIDQGTLKYIGNFQIVDVFGKAVSEIKVYFRENPKDLIRINTTQILLKKIVGLDVRQNFVENCEDSIVAETTIANFLTQFSMQVYGGVTNKTEAELTNRTYFDCSNNSQYSIIIPKISDTSRIYQEGNCIYLEAGNSCEIMNVTERFMVGVYASSKGITI